MAPTTYGEVLARNIRAARTRKDLGQESVAVRMRALGYDAWIRQTVGSTERGRRRVTAEEIFGLSEALETSIAVLVAPVEDDKVVDLPSGAIVTVEHVRESVRGRNDGAVQWDGDVPTFPEPLSTTHQLATAGLTTWSRVSESTGNVRRFDPASGEWAEGGEH